MLLPPTSTTLAPHIGRPRERFLTTPLWPRLPRKSPSCSTLSVLPLTRQRCRQVYLERGHFALIHKHNVLVNAGTLWRRIVDEVAQEFPSVTTDYLHVDAVTIALVRDPQRFDVIVTDLASAVTGGIGLAPSANINTSGEFPSMFEPVHGSAPDIAGTGKADPTAAILSIALLLDHLDRPEDAARVREAVSADNATRASGPARTTSEIGRDIAQRI
mgnify:FL=1